MKQFFLHRLLIIKNILLFKQYFLNRILFLIIVSLYYKSTYAQTPVTSNLVLDLRATNYIATGTWTDASGLNNNQTLPTAVTAPTIQTVSGYTAVNFNGSNYLHNTTSNSFNFTQATIFIAKQKTSTVEGTTISIYDRATNAWNNEFLFFNEKPYHHSNSGAFDFLEHQCYANIPNQNIVVHASQYLNPPNTSDPKISYYVNNILSTNLIDGSGVNPTNYTSTPRNSLIGARRNNSGQITETLTGNIFEILVYNSILTNSQVDSVNEYLQCKYGVLYTTCNIVPICEPNSIENNTLQKIKLYPNPTSAIIYLDTEINSPKEIMIYSTDGKLLIEKKLSISENKIDVSNLSNGIYFLTLKQNGKIIKKKIIKN